MQFIFLKRRFDSVFDKKYDAFVVVIAKFIFE